VILHGTSTTRNALDATQTITSRWAQFRRDGFFNPMSFQQKPDAITVAYIDNGVARGARLLIEMYLAGVSVRRVESTSRRTQRYELIIY
jgi:hypothetical protein